MPPVDLDPGLRALLMQMTASRVQPGNLDPRTAALVAQRCFEGEAHGAFTMVNIEPASGDGVGLTAAALAPGS